MKYQIIKYQKNKKEYKDRERETDNSLIISSPLKKKGREIIILFLVDCFFITTIKNKIGRHFDNNIYFFKFGTT